MAKDKETPTGGARHGDPAVEKTCPIGSCRRDGGEFRASQRLATGTRGSGQSYGPCARNGSRRETPTGEVSISRCDSRGMMRVCSGMSAVRSGVMSKKGEVGGWAAPVVKARVHLLSDAETQNTTTTVYCECMRGACCHMHHHGCGGAQPFFAPRYPAV